MTRLWAGDKRTYKPLGLLLQFAPSLFPEGDFDRLSELDRQRLVTFLNWINDPFFSHSGNFIVLVSDTKSEINRRVLAPPVTAHVEIRCRVRWSAPTSSRSMCRRALPLARRCSLSSVSRPLSRIRQG